MGDPPENKFFVQTLKMSTAYFSVAEILMLPLCESDFRSDQCNSRTVTLFGKWLVNFITQGGYSSVKTKSVEPVLR